MLCLIRACILYIFPAVNNISSLSFFSPTKLAFKFKKSTISSYELHIQPLAKKLQTTIDPNRDRDG